MDAKLVLHSVLSGNLQKFGLSMPEACGPSHATKCLSLVLGNGKGFLPELDISTEF